MKVKEGCFKDEDGNNIIYEINERVTDGTYSFNFWKVGKIYHYSRRKDQHNIEVEKDKLYVVPKRERTLNEYERLIKEFYKENRTNLKSTSFFSCSIKKLDNSYEFEIFDFYENVVNEYLEKTKMSRNELADYIYKHKQSPYSR